MNKLFKVFCFLIVPQVIFAHESTYNVLIIGNGGREHALAWKMAQSPLVNHIFVAPGNGGTCKEKKVTNIAIPATDIAALAQFASTHAIDLTLVGPEAPLACGIVDFFNQKGLVCFGPTQAAAQIESSKIFAKKFMQRHQIPTAQFAQFSDFQTAQSYVQQHTPPFVIKADGLAQGKGVIIVDSKEDALIAIKRILIDKEFGCAGDQIIIEEFLAGEEMSFIVMSDGTHILPFAATQDHKKRYEGDTGPNTGGMGAYSPVSLVTSSLYHQIIEEVINPTIQGLAAEGTPFVGFLYAGLMIPPDGNLKVLEFNCRLGDPEAEPLMMRLQSDLLPLIFAATKGQLHQASAQWDPQSALAVMIVSEGYPEKYAKGSIIQDLPTDQEDIKIFHAGTIAQDQASITSGGRVLCVTALGTTIEDAQNKAYSFIKRISFPHMQYRTDIGYKAIRPITSC